MRSLLLGVAGYIVSLTVTVLPADQYLGSQYYTVLRNTVSAGYRA